jgi:hypothetical protein
MIKQFIKPTTGKIIIFIIFSIYFLGLVERNVWISNDLAVSGRGYPLFFSTSFHPSVWAGLLIVDLLFWYLISCLIVFIYSKLRNKSN